MGDLLGDFGDDSQVPRTDPPTQSGSALDAMLGGSDDEDLFAPPAPLQEAAPAQAPSALIAWQRQKDEELREKDNQDAEKSEALKNQARDSLTKFNNTVSEAQGNRATHNRELDEQKRADLEGVAGNQWEKVVKFVDFNRSDLHEKDVSKFKTLLLQLKH
jgi:hypothetical protein